MGHSVEINSLHEASHAILAQLFCDCFSIQSISLKPKEKFRHVSASKNWGGVNHIKFKHHKKPTPFSMDALLITNWAGFIGQNIGYKGVIAISKERANIVARPNDYITEGIEDDYVVIQKHSPYQAQYKMLDEIDYHSFCRLFVIRYFLDIGAWKYVDEFSNSLLKAQDYTMNRKSIQQSFKKIGYKKFLKEKRTEFLSEYFTLSRKQKLIYFFSNF